MTDFGSSTAVTTRGNENDSTGAEARSADGGEGAGPPKPEDDPGTEASSIDPEELEKLPGTGRQEDEELDIGEVFELLKNERRRRVIRFLKDQEDGTATLDVLAEHIAALENDIEVAQLSSSQRKRVYIGLYQCHLPKMDDFGVVEFRKNRGIIHLRDTALIDRYLPDPDEDADEDADTADEETADEAASVRADRRRLAAAAGVATVSLVGATGLGPLGVVPAVGWTALTVAALLWTAAT